MEIKVQKNIMNRNNEIAAENRQRFIDDGIFTVNVLASPGAGKTSVLLKIIETIDGKIDMAILEGDIASQIDTDKIRKRGIPVMQINTGGGCHLDANMIRVSLSELKPAKNAIFLIENVGNLVCPSSHDLGENMKLLIASVPEGHDKPYKYTSMFAAADAIILNKTDLLPYIDFDKEVFYKGVHALKPDVPVFEMSCKTGDGVADFVNWLKDKRKLWQTQHTK
ncbi:MAG: hydrogenase nickel incorporation protein HypB [Clostridia bacterium]|jgi:hydrogenase nickel incorporation protein HypB|nr:hydrogenase nickel incorporation protein HypB [Clostridia bacterium]